MSYTDRMEHYYHSCGVACGEPVANPHYSHLPPFRHASCVVTDYGLTWILSLMVRHLLPMNVSNRRRGSSSQPRHMCMAHVTCEAGAHKQTASPTCPRQSFSTSTCASNPPACMCHITSNPASSPSSSTSCGMESHAHQPHSLRLHVPTDSRYSGTYHSYVHMPPPFLGHTRASILIMMTHHGG